MNPLSLLLLNLLIGGPLPKEESHWIHQKGAVLISNVNLFDVNHVTLLSSGSPVGYYPQALYSTLSDKWPEETEGYGDKADPRNFLILDKELLKSVKAKATLTFRRQKANADGFYLDEKSLMEMAGSQYDAKTTGTFLPKERNNSLSVVQAGSQGSAMVGSSFADAAADPKIGPVKWVYLSSTYAKEALVAPKSDETGKPAGKKEQAYAMVPDRALTVEWANSDRMVDEINSILDSKAPRLAYGKIAENKEAIKGIDQAKAFKRVVDTSVLTMVVRESEGDSNDSAKEVGKGLSPIFVVRYKGYPYGYLLHYSKKEKGPNNNNPLTAVAIRINFIPEQSDANKMAFYAPANCIFDNIVQPYLETGIPDIADRKPKYSKSTGFSLLPVSQGAGLQAVGANTPAPTTDAASVWFAKFSEVPNASSPDYATEKVVLRYLLKPVAAVSYSVTFATMEDVTPPEYKAIQVFDDACNEMFAAPPNMPATMPKVPAK